MNKHNNIVSSIDTLMSDSLKSMMISDNNESSPSKVHIKFVNSFTLSGYMTMLSSLICHGDITHQVKMMTELTDALTNHDAWITTPTVESIMIETSAVTYELPINNQSLNTIAYNFIITDIRDKTCTVEFSLKTVKTQ
jgi:hypothetical protein